MTKVNGTYDEVEIPHQKRIELVIESHCDKGKKSNQSLN